MRLVASEVCSSTQSYSNCTWAFASQRDRRLARSDEPPAREHFTSAEELFQLRFRSGGNIERQYSSSVCALGPNVPRVRQKPTTGRVTLRNTGTITRSRKRSSLWGNYSLVISQTTTELQQAKTSESPRSKQKKPIPEFLSLLPFASWRAHSSVCFRFLLSRLLSSYTRPSQNGKNRFIPSRWKPSPGRLWVIFFARFLLR